MGNAAVSTIGLKSTTATLSGYIPLGKLVYPSILLWDSAYKLLNIEPISENLKKTQWWLLRSLALTQFWTSSEGFGSWSGSS